MDDYMQIPQPRYTVPGLYIAQSPLIFTTRGRVGVNLRAACDGLLDDLDNSHSQPMMSVAPKRERITLRILWPGYQPWAFVNMAVTGHSRENNNYTTRQLVHALARHIYTFYRDRIRNKPGTDAGLDLHTIDFNRLYLTELQHVSQGSWQPVLYYKFTN
ncbi:hypothetical protein BC835DRAFT_885681 [Cytidiella melzeri]|nr:hypothetical protein BC835DRAFT_885681 [Cytidiella melzeri]